MSRSLADRYEQLKPLFDRGESPTLQAMADCLGFSARSNSLAVVRRLIEAGYLRRVETLGFRPRYELVREADRLATFSDDALLTEVRRRGLA